MVFGGLEPEGKDHGEDNIMQLLVKHSGYYCNQ